MLEELKQNPEARKILGRVEIETIIKRIKGKPLRQVERNYLYRSIKPKLLAARLLTEKRILEQIHRPDNSIEERIIYNLSRYGYELIATKKIKKQRLLSLEELIIEILTKCPQVRFIEAIPILLLKNRINEFRLLEYASKYDIKNQLGYLIEIAMMIGKKRKDLLKLLDYLKKNKDKKTAVLGEEKDEIYKELLFQHSSKRIRKWNLLGRFFDEDFRKIAKVYL